MVFRGPCPPGMEACHNNGDPTDNRLCNLRWDTHANNEADKIRHGTYFIRARLKGERNGNSKLTEEEVRLIREC
jgi:hypothetical protein